MNIKTLEVCSIVPAGEMASRRWVNCTHPHTSHEYIRGKYNRYCPECQVDLHLTENIGNRKQANNAMKIKYTNLKLKSNFDIKRRDTFICWNCYNTYRNSASNALTNSKYCPKCRQEVKNFQRENKHYDKVWVENPITDLTESILRSHQIDSGRVFADGFNQDDSNYTGLGRHTYGKARTDDFYREQEHINRAFTDINKGSSKKLKQPSKNWKKSDITEAEYIDELLGFWEDEIAIEFDNAEDNEDIYYDNNTN